MMKKIQFGKGESALVRSMPEGCNAEKNAALSDAGAIIFSNQEYFTVLSKMYHTFMYDMKEFAVDYLETPFEEYLHHLLWLTYVQSVIYKLDICVEEQLDIPLPQMQQQFFCVRDDLLRFFEQHGLLDSKLQTCLDTVIKFLLLEAEVKQSNERLSQQQIFKILKMKTADLEVLRRIILRLLKIKIPGQEMEFFLLLDSIREAFDDIRDFDEDRMTQSYNTVRYLQQTCGSSAAAIEILTQHIEKECAECLSCARRMRKGRREKSLLIVKQLKREKKYYLEELQRIDYKE